MFSVIVKPASFSLSQSREGKSSSHFKEHLKPIAASSCSFLCCVVVSDNERWKLSILVLWMWLMFRVCGPDWLIFVCSFSVHSFILGKREGGNSNFIEMLNLECLEKKCVCVFRVFPAFQTQGTWKGWFMTQHMKLKGGCPGTRSPLALLPSKSITGCKSVHPVTHEDNLSLSFETYAADIAVSGVFRSWHALKYTFKAHPKSIAYF